MTYGNVVGTGEVDFFFFQEEKEDASERQAIFNRGPRFKKRYKGKEPRPIRKLEEEISEYSWKF